MTADTLLEAEIVLASGEVVRASEQENTDLFWALRGLFPPAFSKEADLTVTQSRWRIGVVTQFKCQAFPHASPAAAMIRNPVFLSY